MEHQKHIKIVGLLYIICGSIGLLGSAIITYVAIKDSMRIMAMESKDDLAWKVTIFIWSAILIILLISLGAIFVGRAIRSDKRWATRWGGFIIAILLLPSFPVGTAIGFYAIWALNKVIKDESTAQIVSQTN